MRLIPTSLLGACLLGLIVGCGGSGKVEMPKNPAPRPKKPTFSPLGGTAPAKAPAAQNPPASPSQPGNPGQ